MTTQEDDDGLIYSFILNGKGGGDEIDWDGLNSWTPDRGFLWVHMDLNLPPVQKWIQDKSGIDPLVMETLLEEEEPRPRCMQAGDGLLVILRAVNHNPGADPDDMLVLRIWVEQSRMITLSSTKLLATRYIQRKIALGIGPTNAATMLDEICSVIMDRVSETVVDLEEFIDRVEEVIIDDKEDEETMGQISEVRRQLSTIRRYISPQRDAMEALPRQMLPWIDRNSRYLYRESGHRLTRILEDIENLRERAQINIDELNSNMSQWAQRNMYMISVLAALFLPLTFLTGLLGINVGGIPLADSENGFLIICLLTLALAISLLTVFKKIKWF